MSPRLRLLAILALPLLAGCESSIRLPSLNSTLGQPQPQIATAPTPQVQAQPLAPPVAQQPLAPPPGAQAAAPATPPEAQPTTTPATGGFGEPPKQATLQPPRQPATPAARPADEGPPPQPTRNSVTGNWSASEASGGSCRITLSSTPKLDLYNAGTSGCQSRELQRVTAWELRGDEVYLYEQGGAVAARLRASGARSFNGALARTGAPVTLSK